MWWTLIHDKGGDCNDKRNGDDDGYCDDGSSVKGGNDDTIYRKLFPPRKLQRSFAALNQNASGQKCDDDHSTCYELKASLLFHQFVIVFILQRDQFEREVL